MAGLVGRPAQRPDLERDAARLQPRDLLRDEGFGQARPALQHDCYTRTRRHRHEPSDQLLKRAEGGEAAGALGRLLRLGRIERGGAAMGMGELLVNETHHVAHAVEQARHDDVARQALLRQLAQRGRHGVRIAAALGLEHLEQAEVARRPGADELLQPGPGTRHDDRPLVEGQDLAKGVVAAHRHHAGGILHQGTEIVGEGERADVAELRGALLEGLARGGRHERAEHDHRAVGNVRIGLVGAPAPSRPARRRRRRRPASPG